LMVPELEIGAVSRLTRSMPAETQPAAYELAHAVTHEWLLYCSCRSSASAIALRSSTTLIAVNSRDSCIFDANIVDGITLMAAPNSGF
jgi:hypothetical protein